MRVSAACRAELRATRVDQLRLLLHMFFQNVSRNSRNRFLRLHLLLHMLLRLLSRLLLHLLLRLLVCLLLQGRVCAQLHTVKSWLTMISSLTDAKTPFPGTPLL